ncbi:MAG: protein-disulfide isomerase, partial [Myxococcota bacterium]
SSPPAVALTRKALRNLRGIPAVVLKPTGGLPANSETETAAIITVTYLLTDANHVVRPSTYARISMTIPAEFAATACLFGTRVDRPMGVGHG